MQCGAGTLTTSGQAMPRLIQASSHDAGHGFSTVGHTAIVACHEVGSLIDAVGGGLGTAPERVGGTISWRF